MFPTRSIKTSARLTTVLHAGSFNVQNFPPQPLHATLEYNQLLYSFRLRYSLSGLNFFDIVQVLH